MMFYLLLLLFHRLTKLCVMDIHCKASLCLSPFPLSHSLPPSILFFSLPPLCLLPSLPPSLFFFFLPPSLYHLFYTFFIISPPLPPPSMYGASHYEVNNMIQVQSAVPWLSSVLRWFQEAQELTQDFIDKVRAPIRIPVHNTFIVLLWNDRETIWKMHLYISEWVFSVRKWREREGNMYMTTKNVKVIVMNIVMD